MKRSRDAWTSTNTSGVGTIAHQTRKKRKYQVVAMSENDAPAVTTKRGRSSTEIIKQFNVANAKIIALLCVLCMILYHGILKSTNGNLIPFLSVFIGNINLLFALVVSGTDTCQGLLTRGKYQGNNLWQPYGCMLHTLSDM